MMESKSEAESLALITPDMVCVNADAGCSPVILLLTRWNSAPG